jgi:hypothetical protein
VLNVHKKKNSKNLPFKINQEKGNEIQRKRDEKRNLKGERKEWEERKEINLRAWMTLREKYGKVNKWREE